MSPARPTASTALKGWRARAWAWVLFLALFKGLVPHAALASVLMSGDPALVWCAPGSPAVAGEGKATQLPATAHACVCAAAADGAPPTVGTVAVFAAAHALPPPLQARLAPTASQALPPPARGPPVL